MKFLGHSLPDLHWFPAGTSADLATRVREISETCLGHSCPRHFRDLSRTLVARSALRADLATRVRDFSEKNRPCISTCAICFRENPTELVTLTMVVHKVANTCSQLHIL